MDLADDLKKRPTSGRMDLWLVAALTVATYFIASALELRELMADRLERFEKWQLDEIPFCLTVFACGLAWYAFRRRQETRAQLRLRELAEARIADLLEHKRELAQQLISLQESERLALARELHDELGQGCTAVRVEIAVLANLVRASGQGLTAGGQDAVLAATRRTDDAALALYESVRDMLRRLRPTNLDSLGLAAALHELCESWSLRTGVPCGMDIRADAEGLDGMGDAIEITIYRVAQEALTNVARHAQARRVQITLDRDSIDGVTLTINDDGRGVDLGAATRGLGLLGAVERAAAVGGELDVSSALGSGMRLSLRIPNGPLSADLNGDPGRDPSRVTDSAQRQPTPRASAVPLNLPEIADRHAPAHAAALRRAA